MFIDEATPNGSPPQPRDQAGHGRQERRQHDARRAAVDGDDAGHERDDAGERAGRGEARQERREQIEAAGLLEQRDEHADAADHQDRRPRHLPDRLLVVGDAQRRQHHGAGERGHADVGVEEQHADQHAQRSTPA